MKMENSDNNNKSPHINCVLDDVEARTLRSRKWSVGFWAIMKFMCLFYHRVVVPHRRTCFSCSVDRFRERSRAGAVERMAQYDSEMDPLLVEYEFEDDKNERYVGTRGLEEMVFLEEEQVCPVCETLWWNRDGMTVKYTEQDIGIGWWNHRGSGAMSSLGLIGALTLIIYDMVCFLQKLWGEPDLILRLMIKMTLYIILLLYPTLSLLSKLRSLLTTSTPCFQWASALNARYLVRRAQILNMGGKGLPGKLFLLFCMTSPLLTAIYRFLIFTVFSECGFQVATVVTSIVTMVFNQSLGLYLYLFYFLRVSFQRQFNLLTLYIKDNEGDEARCKGALFSVAIDYNCFKQLVNLSIFVMFPVLVFGVSGNITYQYLTANAPCTLDPLNQEVYHHNIRLAWLEMLLSLGSYLFAIGGIQVEYVFNNFVINLLHLRSSKYRIFWNNLMKDISHLTNDSYFFLVTIIFSFISLFMAFNFSNQDVDDLVSCNATSHNDLCV